MWNRLSSLIRKEFIQIIRDPRTLAMTFIMPVVMMLSLIHISEPTRPY